VATDAQATFAGTGGAMGRKSVAVGEAVEIELGDLGGTEGVVAEEQEIKDDKGKKVKTKKTKKKKGFN
jgi:fructose/tagatose bisphosphate aldolase